MPALKLPVVSVPDSFERRDLCAPCGGKCCSKHAGAAMPSDFGSTRAEILARLTAALSTGNWAIDWWDGDPRPMRYELGQAYYVRPRHVNTEALWDPTYGGHACVFHSADGCQIFDERPSGCRGLKPGNPDCTVQHSSKQEACIA